MPLNNLAEAMLAGLKDFKELNPLLRKTIAGRILNVNSFCQLPRDIIVNKHLPAMES